MSGLWLNRSVVALAVCLQLWPSWKGTFALCCLEPIFRSYFHLSSHQLWLYRRITFPQHDATLSFIYLLWKLRLWIGSRLHCSIEIRFVQTWTALETELEWCHGEGFMGFPPGTFAKCRIRGKEKGWMDEQWITCGHILLPELWISEHPY